MILDLQTLNYLGHADIYRKAIKLLLKDYLQFYKYERAVKKEELADAEERKGNDHLASLIIDTNADNTTSTHL